MQFPYFYLVGIVITCANSICNRSTDSPGKQDSKDIRAMASKRLFRPDYCRQHFLETIHISKGWDSFFGDVAGLELMILLV